LVEVAEVGPWLDPVTCTIDQQQKNLASAELRRCHRRGYRRDSLAGEPLVGAHG
jgi:hypothetical protein